MITTLLIGKVISGPKSGQSANGKRWCRVILSCPSPGGKEDDPQTTVATVIAFGDEAAKLEGLGKGDTVSAVGSCRVSQWEKDGTVRVSLDILANQVLTPYLIKQKRPHVEAERQDLAAVNRFLGRETGQRDFDDQLSF